MKAGAMQMAGIDNLQVEKKGTIDLVTQVDREVEQMFRALVAERFPDHAVLAEEFEMRGDRQNEAEYCWVFDPVDGTTNYAHGLPIFCCACSLERHRQPIVAAIYDPSRKELFTAQRGRGAWLNGAPMRVSAIADPAGGILQTGVPSRASAESMALFEGRLRTWRKVRMIGSAATALAYVAAGRAEAYRESGSMIWDVAGGCALVKAAGGEFHIGGSGLDQPLEVAAGNARTPLPQ